MSNIQPDRDSTQWLILAQVEEASSCAFAPDWISARNMLAHTIAGVCRAGKLPEGIARQMLESLLDAKPPHPATGWWFATCGEPPCVFRILSPLGVRIPTVQPCSVE